MKVAVVVYSLTGNTRVVAQAVAARLGAPLVTLLAPALRPHAGATFTLGFRTFFLPRTSVQLDRPLPEELDLVVLAAPVWAGRVAFPMRVWLRSAPRLPQSCALVMTGGAPKESAAAMEDFAQCAGRPVAARLYADDSSIRSGQPLPQVESFCGGLTGQSPLDR
ncbi:MAG: flavodoxin family protein [Tabrizicola sp.]|nr:flavodoxin family protein [Tabrizicola sp.]